MGVNLPDDCVIDRILQSLPPSYKSFVMNYNMQGMNKTITELFAMLKAAEVEIKKGASSVDGQQDHWFQEKGQGEEEGELQEEHQASCCSGEELLLRRRNPSLDLSLKLSASTSSRLVTGSGTAPSIWRIRRMAR